MALAVRFRDAVSLSGRFPLLAGISLEIEEGEVIHVRGPNGAGKSSLLRACAGLVPIVSGEAFVLGHDLRADPTSVRSEVGLLGHASFLYDDLSVEENLRFAIRASRGDVGAIDAALDTLELNGRLRSTKVAKLSAGQQKRVAIAALLARAPRLWLLDEAHAGLDSRGREIVDSLVKAAHEQGSTVLLVSHELDRASLLASRVVALAGGGVTISSSSSSREPAEEVRGDGIGNGVAATEQRSSDVA